MASNVEDLTIEYEEDGIVTLKVLDKRDFIQRRLGNDYFSPSKLGQKEKRIRPGSLQYSSLSKTRRPVRTQIEI